MNRLPFPYREVEYIESTGTQFIKTDYKPNNNTHLIAKFFTNGQNNNDFFGTSYDDGDYIFGLYNGSENTYDNYDDDLLLKNGLLNGTLTVDKDKNVTRIIGDERHTLIHEQKIFQSENNLWIFAKNRFEEPFRPCSIKLYSFEVYENDEPILILIPCYDLTDLTKHTAGLYDLVNDIFYENDGSDYFIVGKDVPISDPLPEPDLKSNRFDETYEFTRVAWDNWQEHENYNYILSGNIEKSTESDLKITGSFQFEGYEIPEVNDLIRVYYSFLDDNNVSFRRPIATFLVSYANLQLVDTLEGVKASGTLDGASVLSVLANKLSGRPYTIKKNENAIYKASQIIRELGLQVNYEPSSFCLGKYQTFEGGTSYLEIVNWLLDSAGYRHAYPDEMGVIQLLPLTYKVMEDGEEVITDFTNDEHSIMLPEVDEANDWQSTPNVVRLLYNIDDACIVAYAKNTRGTRASLSARGNREITEFQEVSELGTGNRANNLKVMAENMLRELSCDIEFVTLKHAFVPLTLYDKVSINYDEYSWTGTIETMSIDLSPSTETQTRIKRTIYQEIEIESGAEVLR